MAKYEFRYTFDYRYKNEGDKNFTYDRFLVYTWDFREALRQLYEEERPNTAFLQILDIDYAKIKLD